MNTFLTKRASHLIFNGFNTNARMLFQAETAAQTTIHETKRFLQRHWDVLLDANPFEKNFVLTLEQYMHKLLVSCGVCLVLC